MVVVSLVYLNLASDLILNVFKLLFPFLIPSSLITLWWKILFRFKILIRVLGLFIIFIWHIIVVFAYRIRIICRSFTTRWSMLFFILWFTQLLFATLIAILIYIITSLSTNLSQFLISTAISFFFLLLRLLFIINSSFTLSIFHRVVHFHYIILTFLIFFRVVFLIISIQRKNDEW